MFAIEEPRNMVAKMRGPDPQIAPESRNRVLKR
jgi:hypothetical protein